MEPLERSVSHGTDSESVDTLATNQSMGPALVGNISVDSLDDSNHNRLETPTQQQQQHQDPHEPASETQVKQSDDGDLMKLEPETVSSPSEDEPKQPEAQDRTMEMSISHDAGEVQVQEFTQGDARDKESEQEEEHTEKTEREEVVVAREEEEDDDEDKKEEKVDVKEQKVAFIEDELKRDSMQEEDEEQSQHQQQPSDESISLIKLHDTSNNELFQQTFKTAANASQYSGQFGEELEDNKSEDVMEFAKNYSDELISEGIQRATSGGANNEPGTGGPDLADFELPPYSGSSSSGSEQAATKHSPAKQRKSSNSMATQASSSYQPAGSSAPAIAHDLSAVKNIIMSTYSNVSHIFHWKKPIESGVIFAIGLTLIIALTFFSIISVVAYSALGIILASGMLRIYKTGMKALNRSSETPVDHIWDKALGLNVSLSPEKLHELVDTSHANLNASLVYFKQVLLVEDKIATSKFFLFLYSLTYIGSWFNGLTLITLIYLGLFSVPLIYETNKTKIDELLNLVSKQVCSSISMVTDRVGSILGSQVGGGSKKKD